MRAGALRQRIVLHRPVSVADAMNEARPSWENHGPIGAERRDVSDAERIRAAQEGVTLSSRFRVRASSLTAQVDGEWQLTCSGQLFSIVARREVRSESGALEGFEFSATAAQNREVG